MRAVLLLAFALHLASYAVLSRRPDSIGFAVLFHVGTLAILLLLALIDSSLRGHGLPSRSLFWWPIAYTGYFGTVGVMVALSSGVSPVTAFEFPYRILSSLVGVALILTIRSRRDFVRVFQLVGVLLLVQPARDLIVAALSPQYGLPRLWSAEYNSVLFLGSLGWLITAFLLQWRSDRHGPWKRMLLVLGAIIIMAKVFFTFSRMVWLVILPMNLVLTLWMTRRFQGRGMAFGPAIRKNRRVLIFAAAVVVVAGAGISILVSPVREYLMFRIQLTSAGYNNRMSEVTSALQQWSERPILGWGFGYEMEFVKGGRQREQEYVHNFIMQFLMSGGVMGLLLLVAWLGAIVTGLRRAWKRATTEMHLAVLLSASITVANILVIGLNQTIFLKQETYLLLALISALLAKIHLIAPSVRPGPVPRVPPFDRPLPLRNPRGIRARHPAT